MNALGTGKTATVFEVVRDLKAALPKHEGEVPSFVIRVKGRIVVLPIVVHANTVQRISEGLLEGLKGGQTHIQRVLEHRSLDAAFGVRMWFGK